MRLQLARSEQTRSVDVYTSFREILQFYGPSDIKLHTPSQLTCTVPMG